MFLLLLSLACAVGPGDVDDDDGGSDDGADDGADSGGRPSASAGCGLAPADPSGGVDLTIDAGAAGDGRRGYHLVLPQDYDPDEPHALIIGYPGTDWTGSQIRPYLDLEDGTPGEIFVYPDPLWRDFDGWGTFGGWVLGPYADPAAGEGDLVFTEVLLDHLEDRYCIDTGRVFLTGHSWGGDMAAVAACFLGDRVTAAVPVAANRPYWFDTGSGVVACSGRAAVWTMFGQADDHFTWQEHPGQFGDEQDAFWRAEHSCGSGSEDLGIGAADECVAATDCQVETRYCLYEPSAGHQVPSYFADATMGWFRSF